MDHACLPHLGEGRDRRAQGGLVFFFFNDTATTEIYTLPLHAALPISMVALGKIAAAGFDKKDLVLEPIDPETNSSVIRQRRYARLKLSRNLTLTTTNLRENFRLTVPELNLGGGIGAGERHLAPGTLITLKLTQGVRTIKAQAIVRGARPQAMAFEFVDIDRKSV